MEALPGLGGHMGKQPILDGNLEILPRLKAMPVGGRFEIAISSINDRPIDACFCLVWGQAQRKVEAPSGGEFYIGIVFDPQERQCPICRIDALNDLQLEKLPGETH